MSEQPTGDGAIRALMAALAARVQGCDRRALAEAISTLEAGREESFALVEALVPLLRGTRVAGFTGPPGAGKSTLINALIGHWREEGCKVGVIAVDPSSPLSGGALLGDRVRMTAALDDDQVFVRSLASHGHLGGISPAAVRIIDAFDVAGYDRVIIETVGTGQNEVDIAAVADVGVVIVAPGLGDGIQAMKSGLIEVADVLVVNKADRADAAETAQQLEAALSLAAERPTPVRIIETVATTGQGVKALAGEIDRLGVIADGALPCDLRRLRRGRYIVERLAVEAVRRAFERGARRDIDPLVEAVLAGRLTALDAVRALSTKGS